MREIYKAAGRISKLIMAADLVTWYMGKDRASRRSDKGLLASAGMLRSDGV
jgi:hypothetical protein